MKSSSFLRRADAIISVLGRDSIKSISIDSYSIVVRVSLSFEIIHKLLKYNFKAESGPDYFLFRRYQYWIFIHSENPPF